MPDPPWVTPRTPPSDDPDTGGGDLSGYAQLTGATFTGPVTLQGDAGSIISWTVPGDSGGGGSFGWDEDDRYAFVLEGLPDAGGSSFIVRDPVLPSSMVGIETFGATGDLFLQSDVSAFGGRARGIVNPNGWFFDNPTFDYGASLAARLDKLTLQLLANDVVAASYPWVFETGHESPVRSFRMDRDGHMEWGNGTDAPDITFSRASGGLVVQGSDAQGWSELDVYAPGSLAFPYPATAGAYVDDISALFYVNGGVPGSTVFAATAAGEPQQRFRVTLDGMMVWGDGTDPVDTVLQRDSPGGLRVDGSLAFKRPGAGDNVLYASLDDDVDDRFLLRNTGEMRWGDGAVQDVFLSRYAAGILRISQSGGGIRLTSPDGVQTKTIRLSNAGAVEVVA